MSKISKSVKTHSLDLKKSNGTTADHSNWVVVIQVFFTKMKHLLLHATSFNCYLTNFRTRCELFSPARHPGNWSSTGTLTVTIPTYRYLIIRVRKKGLATIYWLLTYNWTLNEIRAIAFPEKDKHSEHFWVSKHPMNVALRPEEKSRSGRMKHLQKL